MARIHQNKDIALLFGVFRHRVTSSRDIAATEKTIFSFKYEYYRILNKNYEPRDKKRAEFNMRFKN